jgi:hypothetical protein
MFNFSQTMVGQGSLSSFQRQQQQVEAMRAQPEQTVQRRNESFDEYVRRTGGARTPAELQRKKAIWEAAKRKRELSAMRGSSGRAKGGIAGGLSGASFSGLNKAIRIGNTATKIVKPIAVYGAPVAGAVVGAKIAGPKGALIGAGVGGTVGGIANDPKGGKNMLQAIGSALGSNVGKAALAATGIGAAVGIGAYALSRRGSRRRSRHNVIKKKIKNEYYRKADQAVAAGRPGDAAQFLRAARAVR